MSVTAIRMKDAHRKTYPSFCKFTEKINKINYVIHFLLQV